MSLGLLLSELRHKPTITIYVDTSLPTRVQRIEALRRALYREHSTVPASTIEMFDSYARMAEQLISADPDRFTRVDNNAASLDRVARSITDTISARIGKPEQANQRRSQEEPPQPELGRTSRIGGKASAYLAIRDLYDANKV